VGIAGLRRRLQERGYVLGRNLILEERYAEGDPARTRELITELLALGVDVLVTGDFPLILAHTLTATVPIVGVAADFVGVGLILAKAGSTLREAISWEDVDDLRAIVVERKGRIVGLIPPRSGLWRESVSNANRPVDDFVEKTLVICRDINLLSVVLARLKRHRAGAGIVFRGTGAASSARHRRRNHQTGDPRCGDRQLRGLTGRCGRW
jgi:hypothetical protein